LPKKYRKELREEIKVSDEVLITGLMHSIQLLEKSNEEIRKYLEKVEKEEKSNPGPYERILLNAIFSQNDAIMRANETLAKILERTGTLGGINKTLYVIIGKLAVIIALMISILLKIVVL